MSIWMLRAHTHKIVSWRQTIEFWDLGCEPDFRVKPLDLGARPVGSDYQLPGFSPRNPGLLTSEHRVSGSFWIWLKYWYWYTKYVLKNVEFLCMCHFELLFIIFTILIKTYVLIRKTSIQQWPPLKCIIKHSLLNVLKVKYWLYRLNKNNSDIKKNLNSKK